MYLFILSLLLGQTHFDASTYGGGASFGGGKITSPLDIDAVVVGGPSCYGAGDANTGFYWTGSDVIEVYVAGVKVGQYASTGMNILDAIGDGWLYTDHGALAMTRSSDAATTDGYIAAMSAYPLATVNITGDDLKLAAGEGTSKVTITGYGAGCNAGDTITLTLDGVAGTNLATGRYTYGTDWCLAGCTTNETAAASLVAEMATTVGVLPEYTTGTAVVGFKRSNTNVSKLRISVATSDATCVTIANGTDGSINIQHNITTVGSSSGGPAIGTGSAYFATIYSNVYSANASFVAGAFSGGELYNFRGGAATTLVGAGISGYNPKGSDAVSYPLYFKGSQPWALASTNINATNMSLSPSHGARNWLVTTPADCAGETAVIIIDGQTFTAEEGVNWACVGLSTTVCATNLAAALNTAINAVYTQTTTCSSSGARAGCSTQAFTNIFRTSFGTQTFVSGGCGTIVEGTDGNLNIHSNLYFPTDATYNIGAAASGRPYNFHLANDADIAGNLEVHGDSTLPDIYTDNVVVTNNMTLGSHSLAPAMQSTDAEPQVSYVSGKDAYGLATTSTTGGVLTLGGGQGTRSATLVGAVSGCTTSHYVTLTINNTAGTSVATGRYRFGTDFCAAGCASNADAAAEIASACNAGTPGIKATAVGDTVYFNMAMDGTIGVWMVRSIAATSTACATVVSGTNRVIMATSSILPADAGGGTFGTPELGTNSYLWLRGYFNSLTTRTGVSFGGTGAAVYQYALIGNASGSASTMWGIAPYPADRGSDSISPPLEIRVMQPKQISSVNTTGANLKLTPASGVKVWTVTTPASCGGATATINFDGVDYTVTEGVNFTCVGETTGTCATNLRAALNTALGATLCSVSSVSVGCSSLASPLFFRQRFGVQTFVSSGCGTITDGTDGVLETYSDLLFSEDSVYDIGAAASGRPYNVYASNAVIVPEIDVDEVFTEELSVINNKGATMLVSTKSQTVECAGGGGSATLTTAADFVPRGANLLAVTSRVLAGGLTGAASFDLGINGGDVDAFGAGIAPAEYTTSSNADATAVWSNPRILDDQFLITFNTANCTAGKITVTIFMQTFTAAGSD